MDLAKAFDNVKHDLLIKKIACDISIPFAIFVKNYLTERTSKVVVKGIFGDQFCVTSGVPQGSVLGPYLFNIFMGSLGFDFCRNFHSDNYLIIMYADDILIVERVVSFDNHISSVPFIFNWFSTQGLKCNITKCNQSFYAKNNLSSIYHPFAKNYDDLPFNTEFKYLGVIFSCNSNFDTYVDYLINRVSKSIYVIRSLKLSGVCVKDLLTVYDSLILNVILYAFPLFWSFSKQNIAKLNKIHIRCHSIICGKNCSCSTLSNVAYYRSIKFFNVCNIASHPLFYCIPHLLPSGRFSQPFVQTVRRSHSFFPYIVSILNNTYRR